MKPDIRDALERIDTLYPESRLEASRARWRAVWRRERPADRMPFAFSPLRYMPYDDLHTGEERLRATLDDLIDRSGFRDDTIPSIFPGCRQSTLPNLFGAREIRVGNDVTCERIVRSPVDVDGLSWAIAPGTVAWNWLEMQKVMLEESDGRLPIHVVDMQGPFDACAQLCGYENLILMAYDEPDRYHRFLSLMGDAFVAFWQAQERLLGDRFVGTHLFGWDWVPDNHRATLSIDSLVMVSPDFFDEFVEPHLAGIRDRLGPLTVHSCGDFRHMIPSLVRTGSIEGVNASQLGVGQLLEAGLSRDILVILAVPADQAAANMKTIVAEGLSADLSSYGPYPPDESGTRPKPLRDWTAAEMEQFRIVEEELLEAARIPAPVPPACV